MARRNEVPVYRREGEFDCLVSCLKATKKCKCCTSCCPTMRGCCVSLISLRRGTIIFATLQILWQLLRLIVLFAPWTFTFVGYYLAVIFCALLLIFSLLGLIGAIFRKRKLVKFFLWAHFVHAILWFILLIILCRFGGGWSIFATLIVDWLVLWWMFAVGKSYAAVLAEGGTGDGTGSAKVFVKYVPRDSGSEKQAKKEKQDRNGSPMKKDDTTTRRSD